MADVLKLHGKDETQISGMEGRDSTKSSIDKEPYHTLDAIFTGVTSRS